MNIGCANKALKHFKSMGCALVAQATWDNEEKTLGKTAELMS